MLRIIGTSHIAKESLRDVKEAIETGGYDIIALELDAMRLKALLSKRKEGSVIEAIRAVGFKGYLFSAIGGYAERKLGSMVGMQPGAEMLSAYRLGRRRKLRIALIDQPIQTTLKRFSQRLSWRERWHFVADVCKALVGRQTLAFDLSKVPDKRVISTLIRQLKERYPNVYDVLVKERNEVMARNLSSIMAQHPGARILAIVGAGHEDDILRLIEKPAVSYSFG